MNGKASLVSHWISERERIRQAREAGAPPPWTQDPILAAFRFCNVRREDDRVTRWVSNHWRAPYAQHPNLTLAMALARFFNWPPTLEEIGFPFTWDSTRVGFLLRQRAARDERLWNSAYMISTCGRKCPKIDHVLGVADALYRSKLTPQAGQTLEAFWQELCKIDGLGSFLAAQIVADLKNTRGSPLSVAQDWWSFAAPGPGSERGVRWYIDGRHIRGRGWFQAGLQLMAKEVTLPPHIERLHMQDWQNVACELSKYARAVEMGGRKPRRRYRTTEGDYTP